MTTAYSKLAIYNFTEKNQVIATDCSMAVYLTHLIY